MRDNMLKYKKRIDEQGITAELVLEIISAHKPEYQRTTKLYSRYCVDEVDGPEIFNRAIVDYQLDSRSVVRLDDKVNNQLNNPFDVDIIDTKIGYMFGHPISYGVDEDADDIKKEMELFLLRNNADDNDAELGLMASICGYAARLCYIDLEGNERIKNIEPWESVFIGEDIHEPAYSLRYYTFDGNQYAEFYDRYHVYYFSHGDAGFALQNAELHLFDFNPLFGTANNKEFKGDAEKVLALIDAYDRTLSDASNELEQFRLAYLILRGVGADPEDLERFNKSGIFELMGDKDEIKYLTKDINDAMIENHLNRLESNILRFAKSVNFADEQFSGNASGIAMRLKIMALENKSIIMERKFTSTLRYQFKVLFSAWAKRKGFKQEDYLKMFFSFKRNLPANILDEAQTTQLLKGQVSEATRLSLLTFVDDVQYELDQMKQDAFLYESDLEPLIEDGEDDGPVRDQ